MSVSSYPPPPQIAWSDVRSSQPSAVDPAAGEATRSVRATGPPHLSAPASQESIVSVQSGHSSVGPRLETSSSNLSQWTNCTEPTSPTAGAPQPLHKPNNAASSQHLTRIRTPDGTHLGVQQTPANHEQHSPMSVTSPTFTNGTKRTASGHVKADPSLPNTPSTSAFPTRRPRADSISSTGSRAGDLAMSLKTRLGYAMAKVQNGWEHKTIHEVEHLARHKASPHNRHSMSHLDFGSRRPLSNGITNGYSRYSMYETGAPQQQQQYLLETNTAYPPSKRHSGTYASFISASQPTTLPTGPRLQPAADIRPASSSQPHHYLPPHSSAPQANTSATNNNNNNMMSPPRTPVNGAIRRPPTIRTELQTAEAEREALQALFQLGSPQGSQMPRYTTVSQVSSAQASPLRSEFAATPRKVTFARSESDSSAHRLSSDESVVEGDGARGMVEV